MNNELISTARRVNWYTDPELLISDQCKFLCEVMARGTAMDIISVRSNIPDSDFQAAYRNAPPGLFDRRSWAYWGLKLFSDSDYLPYPERFPQASGFDWRS